MDDIFNQILIFLPILLIVFVRMYLENARKKRRDSARLPGGIAESSREPSRIGSFLSSLFSGNFNAQRSSVPKGGGGSAPILARSEVLADDSQMRRDEETIIRTPRPERESRYAVPAYDFAADSTVTAVARNDSGETQAPDTESRPVSRLELLPTLKKAVVMSEILGKPRSLSGPVSTR